MFENAPAYTDAPHRFYEDLILYVLVGRAIGKSTAKGVYDCRAEHRFDYSLLLHPSEVTDA